MASPRASFRLKQDLIEEVLEVFPGETSSHSYVKALEYAVRQKRSELSDNVVPQIETKVSDTTTTPVRQVENKEGGDLSDLLNSVFEMNDSVSLPKTIRDPRSMVINDDPHDDTELV
tara:strand:- start:192 stop:542 length:351 start_codon:yes stop_codon:yes gene_type:complete